MNKLTVKRIPKCQTHTYTHAVKPKQSKQKTPNLKRQ